jgi:hypothetical protein
MHHHHGGDLHYPWLATTGAYRSAAENAKYPSRQASWERPSGSSRINNSPTAERGSTDVRHPIRTGAAVAHYLAARLGLALLSPPSDVSGRRLGSLPASSPYQVGVRGLRLRLYRDRHCCRQLHERQTHLDVRVQGASVTQARPSWWPGCSSDGLAGHSRSTTCTGCWAFSPLPVLQPQPQPLEVPRQSPYFIQRRHSGICLERVVHVALDRHRGGSTARDWARVGIARASVHLIPLEMVRIPFAPSCRAASVRHHLLDKPSAPMLIIGGALDKFSDAYLLLASGDTPKEAWIDPRGGHLGRQPRLWPDPMIFNKVLIPRIVRQANARGTQ